MLIETLNLFGSLCAALVLSIFVFKLTVTVGTQKQVFFFKFVVLAGFVFSSCAVVMNTIRLIGLIFN